MKWMIQWAVTSAALVLIVLGLRWLFRNKLSARWRYALWAVVLVRLLVPFQAELPAKTSDALPVLATNLAPDVDQWMDSTAIYADPVAFYPVGWKPGDEGASGRMPDAGLSQEYIPALIVIGGEGTTYYGFALSKGEVLFLIWAAGAGIAALIILVSNLRFYGGLRKRRKRLEDAESPIPVYGLEGLPSPCLFGVFRPAVYVTPGAAEDPDALRHVLAHELTHYAHFDHIWSLLRCLALAIHWYNPLVWLAVVLSKRDGELACDEGAVARLGEGERIPYGRTLVDMVAARSARPVDLLSCSTAMTGGKKSIQQRVARLVKKPKTIKAALFAAVAVVALSVVFVFAERGQPDTTPRDFLDQVERATAIRYCPPSYSNTIFLDPITDEDLLAEAKEALSGFRYLEDDDPQPDFDTKEILHESGITLAFEGGEEQYSLLYQNDHTYLFPGSILRQAIELQEAEGDTARLQDVSGACVSKRGDNVISTLRRLAGGQSRLSMDPMPMVRSELEEYSQRLLRGVRLQLRGRPDDSGSVEFHAGYTGKASGTVELWYYGDASHDGVWVLSLDAGDYTVLNDRPIVVHNAARDPGEHPQYGALAPAAFAAFLRPEDVVSVTAGSYDPGQAIDLDIPALKEQLTPALYHQITDTYSQEKYGSFAITIRVTGENGQYYPGDGEYDGLSLTLSVGQAEDAVCLYRQNYGYDRNMTSYEFVYSPELYRAILDLAARAEAPRGDLTQEQIDRANEAFRSDVQRSDGSWGPTEISCFFTSSYSDPTKIDLEEFLRYCPLAELLENDEVEEFRAIMEKTDIWDNPDWPVNSPLDLPVPVKRYPREKVSALLQKYTGVKVEQLDWSDCIYVEEYDAFYNFTSDYGPGFFSCAGGQVTGNTVLLWSEPDGTGDRCELTLKKSRNTWLIQSFHTAYPR